MESDRDAQLIWENATGVSVINAHTRSRHRIHSPEMRVTPQHSPATEGTNPALGGREYDFCLSTAATPLWAWSLDQATGEPAQVF
jgi:hypothetical protein